MLKPPGTKWELAGPGVLAEWNFSGRYLGAFLYGPDGIILVSIANEPGIAGFHL